MRGRTTQAKAAAAAFLAALLAALFIVAAGGTAPSGVAHANGVPQTLQLLYLESISNWGPTDGQGDLEFSFSEGYMTLDVRGLPRLIGQTYEGWFVRSATNEAISTGPFNTSADGSAHYEATLPSIRDYSLDLFVITVEVLEERDDSPDQRRSIAGYFSVIGSDAEEASGGETSGAAAGAGGVGDAASDGPANLPETGDSSGFAGSARGLLIIVLGGLVILWAVARTRARVRKERRP